ncbi:AbrB family transcriptional regulator [Brevibacillus gelatini]|uniref:AbrB family transcriptional regulator n=1 Tax=Brevibacillus gelatini TaxID=1655277 RepID=A0A3M8B7S0_9BACL|nr:AbrB family transcriptional regulator [Brevibacillus gelatini]RNB59486.1 AbrB family transcriptional regulator [Brevibacillus gelatini]
MERKVIKIGNSLGVSMTEQLREIGIEQGDTVSVEVNGDEIVVRKVNKIELPDDPKLLIEIQRMIEKHRNK